MSSKKDNQCKCIFATFDPHRKEKCKLFGKKGVLINPNSDAEQKAMVHSSQGISVVNEQENVQNHSATVENVVLEEQQLTSSPTLLMGPTSSLGSNTPHEDQLGLSPPTIELPGSITNVSSTPAALESPLPSPIFATSAMFDPTNPTVAPGPPLSPTSEEEFDELMKTLGF